MQDLPMPSLLDAVGPDADELIMLGTGGFQADVITPHPALPFAAGPWTYQQE